MGSTIRDTQSDQTYDWPHEWLPDHDFDRLPLSKICNNFFFPFEHRMRGRCRRWEHMRVPSHRRAQPQLKIRWNTHCAGWFWQTGVSQNLQSTATATAVMRRPITAKNSAPSALDFMLFHWTASPRIWVVEVELWSFLTLCGGAHVSHFPNPALVAVEMITMIILISPSGIPSQTCGTQSRSTACTPNNTALCLKPGFHHIFRKVMIKHGPQEMFLNSHLLADCGHDKDTISHFTVATSLWVKL